MGSEMKSTKMWAVICSETYAPIVHQYRSIARLEAKLMRRLMDSGKVSVIPVLVTPIKRHGRKA